MGGYRVFLRHLSHCPGEHMPVSKPGPPDWGLCIRPITSSWKKMIILRSPKTDAAIITGKYIARIIVGNKCYHALFHILKERHITHSL
jgi:hypothetical protein